MRPFVVAFMEMLGIVTEHGLISHLLLCCFTKKLWQRLYS